MDLLFVLIMWWLQRVHVYIYIWCHFLCKQATSFPRGNGLRTLTDVKMAILMIIRYFTRGCARGGRGTAKKTAPLFECTSSFFPLIRRRVPLRPQWSMFTPYISHIMVVWRPLIGTTWKTANISRGIQFISQSASNVWVNMWRLLVTTTLDYLCRSTVSVFNE